MSSTPTTAERMSPKWRPSLSFVVFVVLSTVVSLPLVGLYFFRIDENQLVHQTEAELIAEAAALAPAFRHAIETRVPAGVHLGVAALEPDQNASSPYQPILPSLDLGGDPLLGLRPEATGPAAPADPAFQAVGVEMTPYIVDAQRITLSGIRLLDPNGIVIAGRSEVGRSLAQIDEVASALNGHFRSVMRARTFLRDPPPFYSLSRGTGMRVFIAMPVIVRSHVAGVIYLSRTPENIMKQLYGERKKVAIAGISVAILTLIIGLVFHRAITRPVHELIARTAAIGEGDRTAIRPLRHHGTSEFAQLSQSFLDMAAALNRRSDFIATFAAQVSHELKSPLTSIKGAAELLRDDIAIRPPAAGDEPPMNDADRARFLDNIVADAGRLTLITERLRDLARAENALPIGATALSSVLADFSYPGLTVHVDGDLGGRVRMFADDLRIVLSHLADNAVHHGATTLGIHVIRQRGHVELVVRDDGTGISPNNRARIFDSFFTTRRESGGTGMGLAIVRAMLQAHGGGIELVEADRGAAFCISMPFAPERLTLA